MASILSQNSEVGGVAAFLEEASRVLGGQAWLILWDQDLQAAEWFSPVKVEPFSLRIIAEDGSLIRGAIMSRTVALIADPQASSGSPEGPYLIKSGGSWAFLPLVVSEQPVACLVVRAEAAASFDLESFASLKASLPILAVFLRNHVLQRELEARVEERTVEISLLYDVSRSLIFVLSPEDLFQLVGSSLRRALSFEMCGLMLLLSDHREISMQLSAPAEDRALRKLYRLALEEVERLSGQRPSRVPMTVGRIEPSGGVEPIRAADLKSVAHAPLFIRGQVVGLLTVASRAEEAFGEGQMRLLYTIANQASLTLDRIRTAREAETSKIHSMLESMAEGVLLLDGGLRIVMSNPAAKVYVESIIGGRAPRTLSRLGDCRLRPLLSALGKPGAKASTFEVTAAHEGRIFSVTCSPVRGLGGEVQGMVVVISDVTEARVVQLQIAQGERLSALGEMISGVAHELNNPLASVIGFAQLLQNKDVDADIKKKLTAIDLEATRCQRIVQNLLRFARRHTPERRHVDINAALDSVLQLLGHQLQVDDIEVRIDMQADLPPVVGDFHLLQQVFLNIIFNAYQAMKEQGGPGVLSVITRNEDLRIAVEIVDSGPGIAPQNLKRIFDPFFSTKEVGKGTGLGLSLAYGTVREHGGTISARSQLGEGSTFRVELPAAEAAEIARIAQGVFPFEEQAAPMAPAAGPAASPARRILVVEDEASLAEVVAEVLQAQGHHVDTAGDGRTAKARLAEGRYDLIISDLKMPNMNGRDFYRHVASVEPALARRIIFSTGDTANPDTQAFFEEVGNPFLSKPFNLKDLIRVVESVLREI
ncbi:MAG TPA: ATP-binding protein [Patescibacteria group bacterium]|nr:ATP-binding protein [Patescibacteria group bacterium]